MSNIDEKVNAEIEAQRKWSRSRQEHGQEQITDSDLANAQRFARDHRENVRFTIERGWYVWDGRRWAPDEKLIQVQALAKKTALTIFDEIKGAADQRAAFQHARNSQSRKSLDAMVYLARSESGIPASLADFDADPWLFNVNNGTVNLKTGELQPHRREDRITNISSTLFDCDAGFELWDSFMWRITGNSEELYSYLRRVIGYLLTGLTTEQVLHFLYGLGANGKSVFCEIVRDLLGDYAIIAAPELIMARRHSGIPNDIARLRGVRAALMNETTQGARFDEAKLKDLTGGDSLTGRFLHQEFFDFSPTHKLLIRGNHKPSISGTDEGIWRRLRLVPFKVQIPEVEQDKNLLEKLRRELPGILRWAIEGCLEWQRDGMKPPGVVVEAGARYRAESDTLGRFIEEHCEQRALAQVKSSVFFTRYQTFAEQAGERWIPAKELPHEIQRRGFEWKRTKIGGMFLGIELRDTDTTQWEDR